MNAYYLLYFGLMFPGAVSLFYEVPALSVARKGSTRDVAVLLWLTLMLIGLGVVGVIGIFYVEYHNKSVIGGMITATLAFLGVFLISLALGAIFCMAAGDWSPLRLFIRNGWIACLLLFCMIMPGFFNNSTSFYNAILTSTGTVITVTVLIGWHAILAIGLFEWARGKRPPE